MNVAYAAGRIADMQKRDSVTWFAASISPGSCSPWGWPRASSPPSSAACSLGATCRSWTPHIASNGTFTKVSARRTRARLSLSALPAKYAITSLYDYPTSLPLLHSPSPASGNPAMPSGRDEDRLHIGLASSAFLSHPGALRAELALMDSVVARAASLFFRRNITVAMGTSGAVRHNPLHGTEYLLDVTAKGRGGDGEGVEGWRVEAIRTLQPRLETHVSVGGSVEGEGGEVVTFLVPVWVAGTQLDRFLAMYEREFLDAPEPESVRLVLVVPNGVILGDQTASLRARHPEARLLVVDGGPARSRLEALRAGARHLQRHALLFLASVTSDVQPGFLGRCRLNSALGRAVYAPGVFQLYSEAFMFEFSGQPYFLPEIHRADGFWSYPPATACVYQTDFMAGALEWGVVSSGGVVLEVMRAPDVGLWQVWSREDCPQWDDHCQRSKFSDLASRMALAGLVYERNILPNSTRLVLT